MGLGGYDCYHAIGADGLPIKGKIVVEGDVLVGRVRRAAAAAAEDTHTNGAAATAHTAAATAAAPAVATQRCCSAVTQRQGRIASVEVTHTQKGTNVLVRLVSFQSPEVGNKFSCRSAQKGVIGCILPAIDLPRTLRHGMVPDVFFNTAGLVSRMTTAKLLEMLLGKAALVGGRSYANGTSFQNADLAAQAATEELRLHGFDSTLEQMISGITGEVMQGTASVGPLHMSALKHLSRPKCYARGRTGGVDHKTRQPADGRAKDGGMRVGEMEHAALIASGAAATSSEFARSGAFTAHVCVKCGQVSPSPPALTFQTPSNTTRSCVHCSGEAHLLEPVAGTFTEYGVLQPCLAAMGINLKFLLKPATGLI
jgi:DNA-directed RNA polymerase II subunit RPB2